jgi:uncharacterized integral membrane protein (TIGR00698 family)
MRWIKNRKDEILWATLTLVILSFIKSPAIGLLLGLTIAVICKNNVQLFTNKLCKNLLQLSVILLGFKLNFSTVVTVGTSSVGVTACTLMFVLTVGYYLGKFFGLDKKIITLVSSGTAICGGSAIAAIAPVIGANASQIAVSMGVVFLLNAVGLLIYPPIGHFLNMTQEQFGIWCAIAIHDTSSVVGASAIYGAKAAAIATTVKLTRALWILPVSFVFAKIHKSQSKAKFPKFLIGFILASAIKSALPEYDDSWILLSNIGKQMMVGTLFLVGIALTPKDIKAIGIKPLVFAILLWAIISITSLICILKFV